VAASGRLLTRPFMLAVLAELGVCLTIGMLLSTLPLYAEGPLAAGSLGVGLAVAALSPTAVVFQPIAGRVGDVRGRKVLVVSGAFVVAVSVAAYTLASTLLLLVGLRLVTGVGEAFIFVGAATIVTDLAPEERRSEAISLYSLGLWGGLAIGPSLGELVLGDGRYDAVWLTAAGCSLAAVACGLALPETRPERVHSATPGRLVHPAALRPGLVLVASVFGFAGFSAFVALYARELGLDGAGAAFLLFSAVVVGIRIFGRRLPDRLGPKRASGTALALLATGLATIGVWNAPEGLYVGTVVFAAGQALAFPALMTLAVNGIPAAERSSVVGSFTACADVGFAIGALVLGGAAGVAGYDGVFVVCAFAPLVGALLLARIPAAPRVQPARAA
jgi:MFS family permease